MNEEIRSTLVDKKLSGYGGSSELNNYVAEGEITVTITLNEYRELVTAKVKGDVNQNQVNYWEWYNKYNEAVKEIEELKERVASLNETICKLTVGRDKCEEE